MATNTLLFTALLGIIFLAYNIILYFKTRVPITMTPKKYIQDLIKYLKFNNFVDSKSVIYELGSGWGDFSFSLEKLKPSKIVAYELSPIHCVYSYLKVKFRKSNIQFKREDFFEADISDADIIYVYLMPKIVDRLWQKIKDECKPGTIMILLGHSMKEGELIKKIKTDSKKTDSTYYYFYRV